MPGPLEYCLDIWRKIQKQVHCATGPTFVDSLALKKIINVVSMGQFYRCSFRKYSQSPSLKYGKIFLQKKLFMGEVIGDCSTWMELMIALC